MMQDYLPKVEPSKWTMKKLFLAVVIKHDISYRLGDNCKTLGTKIDWWIQRPDEEGAGEVKTQTKRRWSAQLDLGRLLMIMFGIEQAKAAYLRSLQLPDRERLDDTTQRSVKVEYWCRVSDMYNNSDLVVDLTVGHGMADIYCT